MGPLAHDHPAPSAQQVHRSLRWLFVVLWVLVSFHGVVLRRHELWPHGAVVIGIGLVPPLLPLVATWWGQLVLALYGWLVTALLAAAWVAAARHPHDGFLLFLARVVMCVYWLSLSFLIAFGT